MKLSDCKGNWALVTGASSGIGREFADQFAAAGISLVLVARRTQLLESLAAELRGRHGIETLVLGIDLSNPGAAQDVKTRLAEQNIKIRLLCNNAGSGRWGPFEETPPEVYEEMIRLNAVALVATCHLFLPDLLSFPTSAIINVSSPAAYQPVPYMAVYAATKSFVHNFSLALYGEWESRGVHVQTFVPGPTATEFDAKAGAYESALTARGSPADAVAASLRHLERDAPVASSAKGLFKQRFFAGLFPPKMVVREVAKMFRPRASGTHQK